MNARPAVVLIAAAVLAVLTVSPLVAQDKDQEKKKPIPKDSFRVSLPGCTKGYVFTAGRRTTEEPGMFEIGEGTHLRMNGPKDMLKDIKAHEGSRIEVTGLMRKGQYKEGVNIGGGIHVSPGTTPSGGSMMRYPTGTQLSIDVEGWRPLEGACRTS